jgi:hypothetical protein
LIKFLPPLPQYIRIYGTRHIGCPTCDTNIVQAFCANIQECISLIENGT